MKQVMEMEVNKTTAAIKGLAFLELKFEKIFLTSIIKLNLIGPVNMCYLSGCFYRELMPSVWKTEEELSTTSTAQRVLD